MISSGRLAIATTVAVLAVIAFSMPGCTPSDESGGPGITLPGPLGSGSPIPVAPAPTRVGRSGVRIPAPSKGKTVPGGELPKLAGFPGQFRLGDGVTYGAVRIFPIYSTAKTDVPEEYISLAEAQKRGVVDISELDQGGTVNQVEIRNKSEKPIYVVSGDIITGGKQDRVIAMDMVIPPLGNQSVAAEVFCVERGRWSAGSSGYRFAAGSGQACLALKKSLGKSSVSQGEVWSKVGDINAKFGTSSGTGTYRRALEDSGVQSQLEPYVEAFLKEFEKDDKIVGFGVCAGKKVVACDIFLNPSLLQAMREKLIRSYVMGVLTEQDKAGLARVTAKDLADFLGKATQAKVALRKDDANCRVYQLEHSDLEGFYSEVGDKKAHFFLGGK